MGTWSECGYMWVYMDTYGYMNVHQVQIIRKCYRAQTENETVTVTIMYLGSMLWFFTCWLSSRFKLCWRNFYSVRFLSYQVNVKFLICYLIPSIFSANVSRRKQLFLSDEGPMLETLDYRPVYTCDFCGDFSHSDACNWVVESQKYWFIQLCTDGQIHS